MILVSVVGLNILKLELLCTKLTAHQLELPRTLDGCYGRICRTPWISGNALIEYRHCRLQYLIDNRRVASRFVKFAA